MASLPLQCKASFLLMPDTEPCIKEEASSPSSVKKEESHLFEHFKEVDWGSVDEDEEDINIWDDNWDNYDCQNEFCQGLMVRIKHAQKMVRKCERDKFFQEQEKKAEVESEEEERTKQLPEMNTVVYDDDGNEVGRITESTSVEMEDEEVEVKQVKMENGYES